MAGPYYHGMCAAELAAMFPDKYAEVLLTQLATNGSGGNAITEVTAPANFTDFSMFPNGMAPVSGTYQALTSTRQWLYVAGDTQWRYTDLISG